MNEQKYLKSTCHEVKNMLSIISGYAEFITSGMVGYTQAMELSEKIQQEAKNISRFIDNKYLYEIIDKDIYEMNFEPYDITEIYQEAKDTLLEYGFDILTEYQENVVIKAKNTLQVVDRYLIKTLLQKLIANAILYKKQGTEVYVDIEQTEEHLNINIKNMANNITEENLKHLQDPLYRIDKNESRAKGAYGFGLPIAFGIVRLHHGTIEFLYQNEVFQVRVTI